MFEVIFKRKYQSNSMSKLIGSLKVDYHTNSKKYIVLQFQERSVILYQAFVKAIALSLGACTM